ncbi:MAG: nucleotidyltransferase domain-containing protein [Thermodesulfovibrionales bacterium]|nr:nucleotidyltransferase domain-containing protein [Thermodesulfovibrionales bacterium]
MTLPEIFKKYKVKLAYIFGSQKEKGMLFLKGRYVLPEKGTDLDIGVVFDGLPEKKSETYGELYADLTEFFEPFNIDLVFLEETSSLFQYEAIKGEILYYEDELFVDDYEEKIMKKASDLSFKKTEFERDFFEAVRDGYFELENR